MYVAPRLPLVSLDEPQGTLLLVTSDGTGVEPFEGGEEVLSQPQLSGVQLDRAGNTRLWSCHGLCVYNEPLNPIHPIGNCLNKQKPCTKV